MNGTGAGDEHVKGLYDLATHAASAREAMNEAVRRGQLSQYHRVLRETPEVVIAKPLSAVRRQLTELARERRQLTETPTRDEVRQQNEVDALTKAMSAIAHGTLMWADEQLGRQVEPMTAAAMMAMSAAGGMNYGEEQ